jgi:transcriptional regulator with XRE-family HTH domain
MRNSLGSYIRTAREAQGLTQSDVATSLEISQSLVSRWEQGKAYPSEHLKVLAGLLQVDLIALVERQFEICNETERAILNDSRLSRRDQDTLLAAYGVLTDRDSLSHAAMLRTRLEPNDEASTGT